MSILKRIFKKKEIEHFKKTESKQNHSRKKLSYYHSFGTFFSGKIGGFFNTRSLVHFFFNWCSQSHHSFFLIIYGWWKIIDEIGHLFQSFSSTKNGRKRNRNFLLSLRQISQLYERKKAIQKSFPVHFFGFTLFLFLFFIMIALLFLCKKNGP